MSASQQLEARMTDAEWQARCDLAALYRIVHQLGWTDLESIRKCGVFTPWRLEPPYFHCR